MSAYHSSVVISGSILPEMPHNIYYRLVKSAKAAEKTVFVDCKGDLLKEALVASPDYVKIHKSEFEGILGKKLENENDINLI